ncbi:hypothetical protein S40293_11599 [Stachybotrys chartarum IBT 40293]|nr:hypothetical protein S40293_11599 [Stachybotrys chartarum IBT 40293]
MSKHDPNERPFLAWIKDKTHKPIRMRNFYTGDHRSGLISDDGLLKTRDKFDNEDIDRIRALPWEQDYLELKQTFAAFGPKGYRLLTSPESPDPEANAWIQIASLLSTKPHAPDKIMIDLIGARHGVGHVGRGVYRLDEHLWAIVDSFRLPPGTMFIRMRAGPDGSIHESHPFGEYWKF